MIDSFTLFLLGVMVGVVLAKAIHYWVYER